MSGRDDDRYGPWAVVTGASDGIGRAFATALAADGRSLVLCARRAPLAIPSYPSVVCVLRCDVGDDVVVQAVQEVLSTHRCAGGKARLAPSRARSEIVASAPGRRCQ